MLVFEEKIEKILAKWGLKFLITKIKHTTNICFYFVIKNVSTHFAKKQTNKQKTIKWSKK